MIWILRPFSDPVLSLQSHCDFLVAATSNCIKVTYSLVCYQKTPEDNDWFLLCIIHWHTTTGNIWILLKPCHTPQFKWTPSRWNTLKQQQKFSVWQRGPPRPSLSPRIQKHKNQPIQNPVKPKPPSPHFFSLPSGISLAGKVSRC